MIKVWLWIKSYWYVPLIVIGVIITFFSKKSRDWLFKLIEIQQDSYNKEKEILRLHEEEKKKQQQEIDTKYKQIVKELEEKYKVDKSKLDKEKQEDVKKIVEAHNNDPEALTRELAKEFGIEYDDNKIN